MAKKLIDDRAPSQFTSASSALKNHAAAHTPWDRLISYRDAAYFVIRYNAVISAGIMQAYRILLPEYEERADELCKSAYQRLKNIWSVPSMRDSQGAYYCVHPFCRGNFVGALVGDSGDEAQLMYGRVNDFGTYRVEKELDYCAWDIVGSELCRATTQSLMGTADGLATGQRKGPRLDYAMVEALGCGDPHCRIVAESRDKYPMPEHKAWETFGPIATEDQIKHTPEEEMTNDPQCLREECGYEYISGSCQQVGPESLYPNCAISTAATYILPTIDDLIKKGRLDEGFAFHVIHCVLEAAGKAYCGDDAGRKGIIDWLGAPADIKDGRLLGGFIETFAQCMGIGYETIEFNENAVEIEIETGMLLAMQQMERLPDCLTWFWNGMVKTLVSARWFVWQEECDPGAFRIRIAKKIDKFC